MSSPGQDVSAKCPSISQNGASDEAKKLAAAALSAVKDAAALAAVGRGKIEVNFIAVQLILIRFNFRSNGFPSSVAIQFVSIEFLALVFVSVLYEFMAFI